MKCRLKYYDICVARYHFAIHINSFTHTQSFEISRKRKKAFLPHGLTSRAPHAIQNPVAKPVPPPI
ncbi:hypothetical protein HanXRQr2_Chr02g0083661 [Helianthus annuus]|uniref:Uncharacterized protein n=1 Tax=Helianthus annuus TaxID=4232 RepID=A0A9K3JQJ3_HELAN|nr:hypothetical protein HanXRQr2_Chr02g0083661 [Helianthus annuus]KAJ0953187.1 hypothetical protein HanPSC8_Chr02g0081031 [Helianthus annuus]